MEVQRCTGLLARTSCIANSRYRWMRDKLKSHSCSSSEGTSGGTQTATGRRSALEMQRAAEKQGENVEFGHMSGCGLRFLTGLWSGCDQTPAYVTASRSDPYFLSLLLSFFRSVANLIILCSQRQTRHGISNFAVSAFCTLLS